MRFLTIPEVCDRTGLQRTKVFELIHREEFPLPSVKIGRRRLVPDQQLDEWMSAIAAGSDAD